MIGPIQPVIGGENAAAAAAAVYLLLEREQEQLRSKKITLRPPTLVSRPHRNKTMKKIIKTSKSGGGKKLWIGVSRDEW